MGGRKEGGLKERTDETLSRNGDEASGSGSGEAEDVGHVHLAGLHAVGELPREGVEEVGHRHVEGVEAQLHARAGPPTRAERDELEVSALEIRDALPQEAGEIGRAHV